MSGPEDADRDAQAAVFDDEPDHGLRDVAVRGAWRTLLTSVLPARPAAVVDLGCGTGSLAVLLAEEGYAVTGLDLSARMIEAATAKADASGVGVTFRVADAAVPPLMPATFDVVLARHVLWALPDPELAVANWVRLLTPAGVLVLVEGQWSTGGGLAAAQVRAIVARYREHVEVVPLDDPQLWGRPIDDERFMVISRS